MFRLYYVSSRISFASQTKWLVYLLKPFFHPDLFNYISKSRNHCQADYRCLCFANFHLVSTVHQLPPDIYIIGGNTFSLLNENTTSWPLHSWQQNGSRPYLFRKIAVRLRAELPFFRVMSKRIPLSPPLLLCTNRIDRYLIRISVDATWPAGFRTSQIL